MSKLNKIFRSDTLILVLGSAIGQGLGIALTPVVANIYGPHIIGEFQITQSTSLILASFLSLKLEFAALNSKDSDTRKAIFSSAFWLSIGSGIGFSLIFFILHVVGLVRGFGSHFLAAIVMAVLISIINVVNNWSICSNRIKDITYSRLAMYGLVGPFQIVLGLIARSYNFLLFGDILSKLVSILVNLKNGLLLFLRPVQARELSSIVRRNKNFTLYMTFNSVLNVLGTNIIVYFISYHYSSTETGVYGVSRRMLFVPILWLTDSMSKTLIARFNLASSFSEKEKMFNKYIKNSFLFVPLFLLIALTLKFLIPMFFSQEWDELANIIILQMPFFACALIALPLAYVLDLLHKSKIKLVWDISRILFVLILFYYAFNTNLAFKSFVLYFSIINAVFMLVFVLIVKKTISDAKRQNGEVI